MNDAAKKKNDAATNKTEASTRTGVKIPPLNFLGPPRCSSSAMNRVATYIADVCVTSWLVLLERRICNRLRPQISVHWLTCASFACSIDGDDATFRRSRLKYLLRAISVSYVHPESGGN
jgi:hypothetical protein